MSGLHQPYALGGLIEPSKVIWTIREEPLMIWGVVLGQKREKKLNGYSSGKKKTQLNNPEEKKNST